MRLDFEPLAQDLRVVRRAMPQAPIFLQSDPRAEVAEDPRRIAGVDHIRLGIARAFALSPKLLLLDEPFGMLDSLTRWDLQDVLMEVWERTHVTSICVTHDVDEAILLADKVVMMTNGPEATIGKILEVDLPRPRDRKALLEHPKFYAYREEVLQFLADYEHGVKAHAA